MLFWASTSTITVKFPVCRQCQKSGGFSGAHFSREKSKASATWFWACQNGDTVVKGAEVWTESTILTLSSFAQSHFAPGVSFGSSSQFSCKWHQANWPLAKWQGAYRDAPNIKCKRSYRQRYSAVAISNYVPAYRVDECGSSRMLAIPSKHSLC